MVEMLLEFGGDKAIDAEGETPLTACAFFSCPDLHNWTEERRACFELVFARPGTVEALGHGRTTALMRGAGQWSVDVLAKALERCDPLAVDDEGNTALMFAARHGDKEAARLLAGACDATARNEMGWDAGDVASERGYPELAEWLWAQSLAQRERQEIECSSSRTVIGPAKTRL
jgi:hypothetical protein